MHSSISAKNGNNFSSQKKYATNCQYTMAVSNITTSSVASVTVTVEATISVDTECILITERSSTLTLIEICPIATTKQS